MVELVEEPILTLPGPVHNKIISNKKRKTNNDERVEEAYKFMCSVQDKMKQKDDFTVYGENVASRMRVANQSGRAISIAKNRIDNILFQLEMGEFSGNQEASTSFSSPSPKVTSDESVQPLHLLLPQYTDKQPTVYNVTEETWQPISTLHEFLVPK